MATTPGELIPDPATLTELVAQPVEGIWPTCEEERENLFRRLRFASGDTDENDSEETSLESAMLFTELPRKVSASWSTFNGKMLSIYLYLYSFPEPAAPFTRTAHHAVWDLLTGLYGQPTRPWENEEVPPSIWKANGREFASHFFNGCDSQLMFSISGAVLSAAAEAADSPDFRDPDASAPSP